jgi:hypothetical protein
MHTKAEFLALLEKYGLPADLFDIREYHNRDGDTWISIEAPRGMSLTSHNGGLAYGYLHNAEIRESNNIVNYDEFFTPIVTDYKIRCEHAKLLEEVAELRRKNAALAEEITELRLRPGGPDYLAVKEHYEVLYDAHIKK